MPGGGGGQGRRRPPERGAPIVDAPAPTAGSSATGSPTSDHGGPAGRRGRRGALGPRLTAVPPPWRGLACHTGVPWPRHGRSRCPRSLTRRRCRRSPTARWPSGSRSSTGCRSPLARPPPGARSSTRRSSASLLPPAERTVDAALACLDDADRRAARRPRVRRPRARRRGRGAFHAEPRCWCELLPPGGPHHDARRSASS